MGYVAVKGGTTAIEQSIERLKHERLRKGKVMDAADIEAGMSALIGQVMSESGLYDEALAALAIKQAEGSPEESVFLLRAYRSTLQRKYLSRIADTGQMKVERRISASFKDIPGGQLLGASADYTHRLLDFSLLHETDEDAQAWLAAYAAEARQALVSEDEALAEDGRLALPKVLHYLRQEGLLAECPPNDAEPEDITRRSLSFPAARSARLQALTRGQTGAVTALAYAALRGYGAMHPTVGELRVGKLPIYINDPLSGAADLSGEEDAYYIGELQITEAESVFSAAEETDEGGSRLAFEIGYGICYGQNETKAIAMSLLDRCLESGDKRYPTQDEEFVLMHIDSVEATGFISHLKLPHYVTFQSKLDYVRQTRAEGKERGSDEL